MLLLKVLFKGKPLRDLRVSGAEICIGRDPGCDVVLADPLVSRRQAVIRRAGEEYYLEVPEGKGSVSHNGAALSAGSPPVPLHPGDSMEMGDFVVEIAAWAPHGDEPEAPAYVSENQARHDLQVEEGDLDAFLDEGLLKSRNLRGRRVFEHASVQAARVALQTRNTKLMKHRDQPPGLETVKEIVAALGVSAEAINELIAEGRLRAFRDHDEVLLNRGEVSEIMGGGLEGVEMAPPRVAKSPPPQDMDEFPEPPVGFDAHPDRVLLSEASQMLGLREDELRSILDRDPPLVHEDPVGRWIAREDLARIFMVSSGRAAIVEATESPSPAGETEEDPTDDTTEGELKGSRPVHRGSATVINFEIMNPHRIYPLLVKTSRLSAVVRVVPRLPGCLCVPQGADVTPGTSNAEFWVTPQAVGPIPGAAVEFHALGEKIIEARVPCKVRSMTAAWVLFLMAGVFLVVTLLVDAAGVMVPQKTALGEIASAAGGSAPLGLVLSGISFIAGVVWFFACSPREGQGTSVSLSKDS